MLQRIQSIFLLLFAAAMLTVLFAPLWSKSEGPESIKLDAYTIQHVNGDDMLHEASTIYLAIGAIVCALLAIISIFQFKNRLNQMKIGALNALLVAGFMGGMVYWLFQADEWLNPGVKGTIEWGFYLPIVALGCNMLANRFIRKDEKLVRSVDRIR